MNISFGEKIRLIREKKELNQTQFGELVGIPQRKISYIECGKIEPNIEDIRRICLKFGVSANYLLGLPESLNHPKI